MSNVRPLRSTSALSIRPVTTPVPWGTSANPANVPMPRGDEEWGRAANPPDPDDVARLERAAERYGYARMAEMLGDGYLGDPGDLSDYSAWMALSIVEFADNLTEAYERRAKDVVLNIAGATYAARPMRPCAECGGDRPHTLVGAEAMCLVCGERS